MKPLVNVEKFIDGTPEPAVQGNTFVIGGPGNFMMEAGRDIGPFLNSATVTYLEGNNASVSISTTTATFGGGIAGRLHFWLF